jgi:hypothetical protein
MKKLTTLLALALIVCGNVEAKLGEPPSPPKQEEDGTIPEVLKRISFQLKDPDSLRVKWWKAVYGKSPGGNPAWLVKVVWNAKNSYGAYPEENVEVYWLDEKRGWQLWVGQRYVPR